MSEGSPAIYNEGDIVWVKLGSSWWPGEVIDMKNLPKEMVTFKKPPLVIVKFFDEDKFEYVRSWFNIYPYNSDKKSEFIKKGMASHRSKMVHMEKFPQDVATAEVKSGGNPNILSDPAYMPEKKRNIVAELFGSPAPKVKKIKDKKGRVSKSSQKMSHITHRRFLGSDHLDDYRAYVCIQFPGKGRDPNDFEDKEVIRLNSEPEQEYNCQSCSFSTKSIEIMIFHTKSHLQGVYVSSTGKKLGPKKEKSRIVDLKQRKSKTIKKPKQKKTNSSTPIQPQIKPEEVIKKAAALPSELLAEWDDSEDEDMEAGPSGVPTNTSQDSSAALDSTLESSVMETSQEATTINNTTLNTSMDTTSTEAEEESLNESSMEKETIVNVSETKADDDTVDRKERSASSELFSDEDDDEDNNVPAKIEASPTKAKPKKGTSKVKSSRMIGDQSTHDAIKSCFDFEEDEDEPPLVSTVISGRKIPRVIPLTERKKSNEMDEDDLNKEQILKVSESFTKKLSEKDKDSQEMDNAFKELMETTKLPDLPDMQNTLKCEQNFHNIETIKFPDKPLDADGASPPKLKTDKKKSDSSEIATKLTNPKKRFVKSFEALRKQNEIEQKVEEEEEESSCGGTKKISAQSFEAFEKMQNEIRLQQEADKTINEYGEYPEPAPKRMKINKDVDEQITFAKLKTKIMSKIIEEANIHEESKNKIMTLMSPDRKQQQAEEEKPTRTRRSLGMHHQSPRSKILETYRNQNEIIEPVKKNNETVEPKPDVATKESHKKNVVESVPPKKNKWTRGGNHPKKDRKFVEETDKDNTTSSDNSVSLKQIQKEVDDDIQQTMEKKDDKIMELGMEEKEIIHNSSQTANLIVSNNDNAIADENTPAITKVNETNPYNNDDGRSETPLMDEPPFNEEEQLLLSNDSNDKNQSKNNDIEEKAPTPQLSKLLHENHHNQSEEMFGTTSYSYSFTTTGMDDFSSLGHASPALPENAICLPPKKSKKRKLSKCMEQSNDNNNPEKTSSALIIQDHHQSAKKKKQQHEQYEPSLLLLKEEEKEIVSDNPVVDATFTEQTDTVDKTIDGNTGPNIEENSAKLTGGTSKELEQIVEEQNIIVQQTEEVIEETVIITEQLLEVEDQHDEKLVLHQHTIEIKSNTTEEEVKSTENLQGSNVAEQCEPVKDEVDVIEETPIKKLEDTTDTADVVSRGELNEPLLVQNIKNAQLDDNSVVVTENIECSNSKSEDTSKGGEDDFSLEYPQLECSIQQTVIGTKEKQEQDDDENIQQLEGGGGTVITEEEISADLEVVQQQQISDNEIIIETAENLVQEDGTILRSDEQNVEGVSMDKSVISGGSVNQEDGSSVAVETAPDAIEEKRCAIKDSNDDGEILSKNQHENSETLIHTDTIIDNIQNIMIEEHHQATIIETEKVMDEEIINEAIVEEAEKNDVDASKNEEKPNENNTENVIEQIDNLNTEDTQQNKIEDKSNKVDNDLNVSIEPNLTKFSTKEELAVIPSTKLEEVKSDGSDSNTSEDAVVKRCDQTIIESPSYTSLPESELVTIEGNLTVMSEKDLADVQVEITPKQVINTKKPVMLSNFSMDFSESTTSSLSDELDSKGTEFTTGAMTKELKLAKKFTKKPNTYERLELLDILEGNSDQDQRKLKDRKTLSKSFVADDSICDFEEHIPSQIVCAETLRREKEDERKEKSNNKDKEKDKNYKNMITTTTSKLLERLSEGKPKEVVVKHADAQKGTIKLARSKTVDNTSSSSKLVVNKSKKMLDDIEDVQAFVIPKKDMKKADTEPDADHLIKTATKLSKPKAKILQQTIITPAGEIIQPSDGLAHHQTTDDNNIFDINSMPIVLSDEILTPESIEKMSIVIGGSDAATAPTTTKSSMSSHDKVLVSTAGGKPVLKKFISSKGAGTSGSTSGTLLVNQTTIIKPSTSTTAKITRVPKILQKQQQQPSVISGITKPGKYIIVPQSAGLPATNKFAAKKTTLIKRPPNASSSSGIKMPATSAESTTGNKIMVVTNQQGQQQRLLLTPAQQKMFGYAGAKVTKTIVKSSNIVQKNVHASSESMPTKTNTVIGQKLIIGTNSPSNLTTTIGPNPQMRTITKRFQPSTTQKVVAHQTPKQKTILITTKQGQTLRKIHGTEEELEKQVAEQLEAIRASSSGSSAKFSAQPKVSETLTLNKASPKSPRRSYSKKPEFKQRTGPPPLAEIQSTATKIMETRKPETSQSSSTVVMDVKQQPTTKTVTTEPTKPKPDRPLNQLVIQDALGNQTTITEGQILALPSETVDGQPQSYMLVTLDESGNLTPLNNEALMSLDPNLGLGGDLSNMVLQIDQSAALQQHQQGNTTTTNIEQQRLPLTQSATVKPNELPTAPNNIKVDTQEVAVTTTTITETVTTENIIEQKQPPESINLSIDQHQQQQQIVASSNSDAAAAGGQQLIVTGDPIATQKFLESLTEGTTDLANILASAEGNSILIQADGQQILINTNADNQMMLSVNSDNINSSENTEGGGNPIFATQPTKNQDILAAALADTDVFQSDQHTQNKIVSQLSPNNNALYPINVGNVLETSLTLSSPIMTPLEVPSTNNKKIPDDETTDILTQVPKNVDLPITITDPNISQTVANQQVVASMIANELQTNLELNLPISETTISTVTSDMNSPSYSSYSLPTLDDTVVDITTHKPFSSSMPLLTEEDEEESKKNAKKASDDCTNSNSADSNTIVIGENHNQEEILQQNNEDSNSVDSKKPDDSINSDGSFLDDEGRFTLGGEMCSSLSEPPPEMFDLPEIVRYGR